MDSVIGMDPLHSEHKPWDVEILGEEVRNLQAKKSGDLGEEGWENVRDTAAAILSQCPNPKDREGKVTGLALGKIQSGKTLSYTTLIALAIDNGYRITVVIAGTKNPLLEQNYARLCKDLETEERAKLIPFENPTIQLEEVIQNVIQGGGHVLIVLLKNRKRIDDVSSILRTPELRGFPTLIIDDEGDEASLNTRFRKKEESATYSSILKLRDSLHVHAYLAYTATPQANLLISGIDDLSPDFGVLVQPGKDYCGGSLFFGPDRDLYLREIPLGEEDMDPGGGIPDGLRQAIATFLVGGAIVHLRENLARHSMLIHNSHLRADHERLENSVKNLISLWKDKLGYPDSDPARVVLMTTFRDAYDDLTKTVKNPPTWELVKQRLPGELLLETWMVNCLPSGKDPIATTFRLKNNILIGGNMLGRGVTIPGLAVTYITRRAKKETNADTMEQRSRWFGYKKKYLDVCRIFLTPILIRDYTELLRHEDDLWESLGRNEKQGLSIRDWPRMLTLSTDMGLNPTRSNVAKFKQFQWKEWEIQRKVVVDREMANRNVQTVRDFFSKHQGQVRAYARTEHILVRECPVEGVITELLGNLQLDGTDWENLYTKEFLARLFLGGRLSTIDVLWMAKGDARERELEDNNGNVVARKINNPMQGRTDGKRPEERDYYPGDSNLHEGRPQLQVHMIRPKGTDLLTTALALYFPEEERYDLRSVVRDETIQ